MRNTTEIYQEYFVGKHSPVEVGKAVHEVTHPKKEATEIIARVSRLKGISFAGSKPTKTGGTVEIRLAVPALAPKLLRISGRQYSHGDAWFAEEVIHALLETCPDQCTIQSTANGPRSRYSKWNTSAQSGFSPKQIVNLFAEFCHQLMPNGSHTLGSVVLLEHAGVMQAIKSAVIQGMQDPRIQQNRTTHAIGGHEKRAREAILQLMKLGLPTERLVEIMREEEVRAVMST